MLTFFAFALFFSLFSSFSFQTKQGCPAGRQAVRSEAHVSVGFCSSRFFYFLLIFSFSLSVSSTLVGLHTKAYTQAFSFRNPCFIFLYPFVCSSGVVFAGGSSHFFEDRKLITAFLVFFLLFDQRNKVHGFLNRQQYSLFLFALPRLTAGNISLKFSPSFQQKQRWWMYKHSDRPGCNLHHFCLPAFSFTLPLFLFIYWLSVLFCLSMRCPSLSRTAHFCLLLIMMPHNHDPGMNHFMIYISSVLKYFFWRSWGLCQCTRVGK